MPYCQTWAWLAAQSQPSGTLSGLVVDDSSRPIANCPVGYNNLMGLKPFKGVRRVGAVVKTDAAGKFQALNLPHGTYYVCAIGAAREHLKACTFVGVWQNPREARVVVPTGALLRILVKDPSGRILPATRFAVGVFYGQGTIKAATLVKQGGDGPGR